MLTFIKAYWQFVLLFLFGAAIAACNAINGDVGNTIFAIAFCVLTFYAWMKKSDYDEIYEDHASLIVDYVKELNSNLDFMKNTQQKLADVLLDEEPVKAKRGRPKKVVQPVKGKRGRPRKNA